VTSAEPTPCGNGSQWPAGSMPPLRRRQRDLLINAAVLILILVVAMAGALIQRSRAGAETIVYAGPYAPTTRTAGDTVTMAQPGVTRPVLQVYEDFQCSVCYQFEVANGGLVERLAYEGLVKVVYHPFTIFVGSQPRQANSTRAWAAAMCVPGRSWVQYHNLLYTHQPAETAQDGFPVTQLLAIGRLSRLTGSDFTQCVTSQRYAAQIVRLSNRITDSGINATPTVTLNGRHVSLSDLVTVNGALSDAIIGAR
jgi:protein-disulfide isomerase